MATLLTRWKTKLSHCDAFTFDSEAHRSRQLDVADELGIDIDADGSPVSMPEAEWLVCFVPGLRPQWWHPFAHPSHKHVFAIRKLENDTWLLVEPWWTRLMVNVLTFDQALNFLRWGSTGHILKVRESIPGHGNQMRGWSNCAVLMTFLIGRSYWTWSPDGLYRRLAAEAGVQPIDLLPWLGEHVQSLADKVIIQVSNVSWPAGGQSLQDALLAHGSGLMAALTSPPAKELQSAALSKFSALTELADDRWHSVMNRAIESLLPLLEVSSANGEIDVEVGPTLARHFVLMLLSRVRPINGTSMGPSTDPLANRRHVAAVVTAFLAGTTHRNDARPTTSRRTSRVAEQPSLGAFAWR